MYHRISNRLDVKLLEKTMSLAEIPNVVGRISEIIATLDENYGINRGNGTMGGYVLFFGTSSEYSNLKNDIFEYYKLDEDLYEYSDVIAISGIGKNSVEWVEELYLLSSDDALVFVYPRER